MCPISLIFDTVSGSNDKAPVNFEKITHHKLSIISDTSYPNISSFIYIYMCKANMYICIHLVWVDLQITCNVYHNDWIWYEWFYEFIRICPVLVLIIRYSINHIYIYIYNGNPIKLPTLCTQWHNQGQWHHESCCLILYERIVSLRCLMILHWRGSEA